MHISKFLKNFVEGIGRIGLVLPQTKPNRTNKQEVERDITLIEDAEKLRRDYRDCFAEIEEVLDRTINETNK